jgi:hypothetical protein
LLTNYSVTVKDLVELAKLKEENLVVVVLFELPKLIHSRSKGRPSISRDEQSCAVIFRCPRSIFIDVSQFVFSQENREGF